MKRGCLGVIVLAVGLLWLGSGVCLAQNKAVTPSSDVDGKVWMQSTPQEKQAFLLGVGNTVALEYHIREKHGEAPSRFVQGWVAALKDMSWLELSNKIDAYYKNNPDKTGRNIFDVIWHELIAPVIKQ